MKAAEPCAPGESSALLVEEAQPRGCCSGFAKDLEDSLVDAHALVHLACLFISCKLETLAQAKAVSRDWRSNVWVCRLCFLYYPSVLGFTTIKFIGRSTLRILACGGESWGSPMRDVESVYEFQVRAFWITPMTGWFTIVFFFSILQAVFTSFHKSDWHDDENLMHSIWRKYMGELTRLILSMSFIAGGVLLIHAMRRRDVLLMRACVLGFVAFALSMLVMVIVSYSAFPGSDSGLQVWDNFFTYVTLVFSIISVIAFSWYAIVCLLLYREYHTNEPPALDDSRCLERVGALLVVALICIVVVGLNVWSVCTDPRAYWDSMG